MEQAKFIELIDRLEEAAGGIGAIELVDLEYRAYSFGSGTSVHRTKSILIRMTWDGKEEDLEVHTSPKRSKYPNSEWSLVYSGAMPEFIEGPMRKVLAGL